MTASEHLTNLHARLTSGTALEQLLAQDEVEDALPALAAVVAAAEKRIRVGCSSPCSSLLTIDQPCDCGHDDLVRADAELRRVLGDNQ